MLAQPEPLSAIERNSVLLAAVAAASGMTAASTMLTRTGDDGSGGVCGYSARDDVADLVGRRCRDSG